MKTYGLTNKDLTYVKDKLKKQRDYLESNTFVTSNGVVKSLLDVSYSANHSRRYYARILNKVNTFVSYNLSVGLVPVFLTVTLDGFFRDFLKRDFTRWEKNKDKYSKHIPNCERFGYILDSINNKEEITVKHLYKVLSFQFRNFLRSGSLQKLKKDGFTYSYIRVTEPHKDGVPHFHILFYVPKFFLPKLFVAFKKFPAPQNHAPILDREVLTFGDYRETQGFQIQIKDASSYILKYILKSFVDSVSKKEVDYLQAWYVYHRIPRLITSHTLIAQQVYTILSIYENDWFYLTDISKRFKYVRHKDYFSLTDGFRVFFYDSGLLRVHNQGLLVFSYGKKKYTLPKYRLRSLSFSTLKPVNFNVLYRYTVYVSGITYKKD